MGGPSARRAAQVALAVLVACACLEACQGVPVQGYGYTQSPRFTARTTGTYCGLRLSNALKLLCNGQYNSYFKPKKTPEPLSSLQAPPTQLPFLDRLKASALLEARPRVARGVYDECCFKSCTVNELMNYCMTNNYF